MHIGRNAAEQPAVDAATACTDDTTPPAATPSRRVRIARALRRPAAGVVVVAPLALVLTVGGSAPTRTVATYHGDAAGITPLAAVSPTPPTPASRSGVTVVAADRAPRAVHMDPATVVSPPPASLVMAPGGLRIPPIALNAYRTAEKIMATSVPNCGISWNLLAGIGRIESGHANNGATDARGTAVYPIYGPVLDGSLNGNEIIVQSVAAGRVYYARALGPMQFLPGTWARYAADAVGDGSPDVQNIFDASLAAARYLCSGGLNLRDPSQVLTAILRYNNSMAYAQNVLGWAKAYVTGIAPVDLPPIVGPPPAIGDQHLDNPEGLGPGLPLNAMGLPSDDPLALTPAMQMGHTGPVPGPPLAPGQVPQQNCAVFCLQSTPAPGAPLPPEAVPASAAVPAPDAPPAPAGPPPFAPPPLAPAPFAPPPFAPPPLAPAPFAPPPFAPAPVAPAPVGPAPAPPLLAGPPAADPLAPPPALGPPPGPAS